MTNMLHMKLMMSAGFLALTLSNGVSALELDLKPISNLERSYKVSGICFLPDCNEYLLSGDIDMDINKESKWCENNGYFYTCPTNMAKIPKQECPRDPSYSKCSLEQYCKDKGYKETSTTCKLRGENYYPNTTKKCPNGLNMYAECVINNQQGCVDAGYVNTCSGGRLYKDTNRCPYDKSYGKCCSAVASAGCPSNYKVDCAGAVSGADTCGYGCKQCDPCSGYYTCNGTWQYCTGKTCSDGTGRCSNYCANDYFPNSCSSSSCCSGSYRNGYCSGACSCSSSSGNSSGSGSSGGGCNGAPYNSTTGECYFHFRCCDHYSHIWGACDGSNGDVTTPCSTVASHHHCSSGYSCDSGSDDCYCWRSAYYH